MASVAMADSVDPTVVIRNQDPPNPIAVTQSGQTFVFTATPNNNIVTFQNQIGQTITSLTLTLFGVNIFTGDNLTFSCGEDAGGGLFDSCSSSQGRLGSTVVSFTGGIGLASAVSGIELESLSSFNHSSGGACGTNCVGGIYEIVFGGADFTQGSIVLGFGTGDVGTAATPEPASGLLLLGGLAGLAAWRKRAKKAAATEVAA
jgi:hypothetical protein